MPIERPSYLMVRAFLSVGEERGASMMPFL